MSDLGDLNFDANQVEPNSFELIPPGDYDAVIVKSETKGTSTGGKMLKLKLQILNGQYQNRLLFDNLNLWNQSADAVKIAKGTLSSICRAVNVPTPKDSAELCNKPLRITVGIQKGTGNYNDQNCVKSYKPRQAGPAPVEAGAVSSSAPAGKPW